VLSSWEIKPQEIEQPVNMIERGREFVQQLCRLGSRSARDWRVCPSCGSTVTCKHGTYTRHPWYLDGQQEVRVQRHKCCECEGTYSEDSPLLVPRGWYGRDVRRFAIDHWQHVGSSLRRTAELVRSIVGRQERWLCWRPLDEPPSEGARCHLSETTVHRWLDGAGRQAEESVSRQLEGVPTSGQMGADGLWARLRGRAKRVVLLLVDSVTGIIWPPVVVEGEQSRDSWWQMFERAREAGLDLDALRGVTSDAAQGLLGCLRVMLKWVNHQRCVWHLWPILRREITQVGSMAAKGLTGEAAKSKQEEVCEQLVPLVQGVLDASSLPQAESALAELMTHPQGKELAHKTGKALDAAVVHLLSYNQGLMRVSPEWCWRDFRLRLSRGRNHGSDQRVERAALLWAVYRNFTPAQWRSERKRHYRRPGMSPLAMAGVEVGRVSYLDVLGI